MTYTGWRGTWSRSSRATIWTMALAEDACRTVRRQGHLETALAYQWPSLPRTDTCREAENVNAVYGQLLGCLQRMIITLADLRPNMKVECARDVGGVPGSRADRRNAIPHSGTIHQGAHGAHIGGRRPRRRPGHGIATEMRQAGSHSGARKYAGVVWPHAPHDTRNLGSPRRCAAPTVASAHTELKTEVRLCLVGETGFVGCTGKAAYPNGQKFATKC